ncbi:MAG: methyltransferase domain-containing protein [Sphaerospermopsis sp. SIO1G2]|nr:methyltransferase domain-containing protein [Sphaerospermopsis sp. SIO1G1]NET73671.1 methyltransferase domain-containing protein [Sphaerospermopsis sp. SIO1G2]
MNTNRKTKFLSCLSILIIIFGVNIFIPVIPIAIADQHTHTKTIYEQRQNHSSDGIGKFYMGREIANVMGYTGAGWLERPSREIEEKTSQIVELLDLKPDHVVADIGAGTGYLSFLIAPLLTEGKVLAVDIQPQMLEIIDYFKQEKNINNVQPILATETNPNLPATSIDFAIFVDAYHELGYPQEVMTEIVKALKPGGKVVLVEYRAENPFIRIKRLHKMSQRQVKKEMQAVGLVFQETKNNLPQQHFMVFTKA